MAVVGQMVKEPNEEITVEIDFAHDLVEGETVDLAEVTSKNGATLADTSLAFLSAAGHEITTPVVAKRCQGGAHGETHLVQMKVTTNLGNEFEAEIEVLVAEN